MKPRLHGRPVGALMGRNGVACGWERGFVRWRREWLLAVSTIVEPEQHLSLSVKALKRDKIDIAKHVRAVGVLRLGTASSGTRTARMVLSLGPRPDTAMMAFPADQSRVARYRARRSDRWEPRLGKICVRQSRVWVSWNAVTGNGPSGKKQQNASNAPHQPWMARPIRRFFFVWVIPMQV